MATSVLAGALGLLGKKPIVPPAAYVDPQAAQSRAITGDLAAIPDLAALTDQVNKLSVDELLKSMERFMPGYSNLLGEGTKQIASFLKGELPDDVVSQIQRRAAERATAGGYEGSGVQRNLTARDLGLTSLDLISRGISTAESWMNMARAAAPMFDFTRMFISPAQQITAEQWNETNRFNQQWMVNRLKAMPSPTEAAAAGFFNAFATAGENYISSAGGYALGSGGGKSTDKAPDYSLGSDPSFIESGGRGTYGMDQIGFTGGFSGE